MNPAALLPPSNQHPCPSVPPVALKLTVSVLTVFVPEEIVAEEVELPLLTTHVPEETVVVGADRMVTGSGTVNICVELVL